MSAVHRNIVYESEGKRRGPTLRVTVHGGEGSFLVPFDPYCRPDFEEWKETIRREMCQRQIPSSWFDKNNKTPFPMANLSLTATIPQKASVGQRAATTTTTSTGFTSSFVDIDVEDNGDITVLCNTLKDQQQQQPQGQTKEVEDDLSAYGVFLTATVAEPLTEDEHYRTQEEQRCADQSSILDTVVLQDFQELQVNLAHTPPRSQAAANMIRVLRDRETS